MCGIAGLICRDPREPVEESRLRRMLDAIRHRGPDDEGTFVDGHVALGMRRLSIIDLEGGHQPIYDESGRRLIFFNGEIYNYRELKRDLEGRGHRFRTTSDTETIVHLHEELGEGCVEPLRGMYAFAVWDTQDKELLLAIDRFGIKPLYVTCDDRHIAFASELKALKAGGFLDGPLDWEALEGLFRVGYVPAPRTPFAGVRKLEPGELMTWRPGTDPVTRRYWDVPTRKSEHHPNPVELVREAIDDSVSAHLVADVPLAAFLSGGLDSSAVVSSMALGGEDVHAYTVRFTGSGADEADETDLASALAKRYGVDLTVVDVAPDIEAIFEPIMTALDEPLGDESVVPTWLLCEAVARDYKVALAGTGGDELFGGYRRHFGLASANAWHRVPRPIRHAISGLGSALPEPRGGGLNITRLKRFLRSGGDTVASRYLSLQNRLASTSLFHEDVRESIAQGFTEQTFDRHGASAPTDGRVRPALYLDYRTYLPGDLLHLADRISMAHSLEMRVPFVDHRLVEAVFPLPDSIRVGRGMGRPKHLLRRALRDRLPREHFTAPKRGFVGPTALWLRHELAEMLGDELSPDRLGGLGFFDVTEVQRLHREHAERRQNHEGVLWGLLCFLTWHRSYVSGSAA